MTPDDVDEVVEALGRIGVEGVSRVHTYRGDFKRSDETYHAVTVEIHDHGLRAGDSRWKVFARDDEGRTVTSNGDEQLQRALDFARWEALDPS